MNYDAMITERVNYHYADFLRDCQAHHIHDDISRAVWNLSRALMHDYGCEDYRAYLTDNLYEDYDIYYDDIYFEIEDKVWDGLDLQTKGEDVESYRSEYPEYSIIGILDRLNYYWEGEQ